MFFEASPGPVSVTGTTAVGNEIGIHFANTENGTLSGNRLGSNSLAEVYAGGQPPTVGVVP